MAFLPLVALLSVVAAPSEPAPDTTVEVEVPEVCPRKPLHVKLGDIDGAGILPTVLALNEAVQTKAPVLIIDIDSRGGSVGLGMGLIGLMRQARDEGVFIQCEVVPSGLAASMAAVILESSGCSTRVMHATSVLMFHEPSIHELDSGKAGELRRLADELEDLNHRMAIMMAPRFHWTTKRYEQWLAGHDRWLDLDEAREAHLVDSWLP